jgi:hypothetical protein
VRTQPLSPLGERVSRDGAFSSRRGTGEGVLKPAPIAGPALPNRTGDGKPPPTKLGTGSQTGSITSLCEAFTQTPTGLTSPAPPGPLRSSYPVSVGFTHGYSRCAPSGQFSVIPLCPKASTQPHPPLTLTFNPREFCYILSARFCQQGVGKIFYGSGHL